MDMKEMKNVFMTLITAIIVLTICFVADIVLAGVIALVAVFFNKIIAVYLFIGLTFGLLLIEIPFVAYATFKSIKKGENESGT